LSYWIEDYNDWFYRQTSKLDQMAEPMMERLLAIMADKKS
jgi:hypothetical protein